MKYKKLFLFLFILLFTQAVFANNVIRTDQNNFKKKIKNHYKLVESKKNIHIFQDKRINNKNWNPIEDSLKSYYPLLLMYSNKSIEYFKFEKPVYNYFSITNNLILISIDYSIGMGSYAGPTLFIFHIDKNNLKQLKFYDDNSTLQLMKYLKDDYQIFFKQKNNFDLLAWSCRPKYIKKKDLPLFTTTYKEYQYFNGNLFKTFLYSRYEFLENENNDILKSKKSFFKYLSQEKYEDDKFAQFNKKINSQITTFINNWLDAHNNKKILQMSKFYNKNLYQYYSSINTPLNKVINSKKEFFEKFQNINLQGSEYKYSKNGKYENIIYLKSFTLSNTTQQIKGKTLSYLMPVKTNDNYKIVVERDLYAIK